MAPWDPHRNLAISQVVVAPSPPTTGTRLNVDPGEGVFFPDPATEGAYEISVWPSQQLQVQSNSEVMRVISKSGDELTVLRAQEGTTARQIQVGDIVALTLTRKSLEDIEKRVYLSADQTGVQDIGPVVQAALDAGETNMHIDGRWYTDRLTGVLTKPRFNWVSPVFDAFTDPTMCWSLNFHGGTWVIPASHNLPKIAEWDSYMNANLAGAGGGTSPLAGAPACLFPNMLKPAGWSPGQAVPGGILTMTGANAAGAGFKPKPRGAIRGFRFDASAAGGYIGAIYANTAGVTVEEFALVNGLYILTWDGYSDGMLIRNGSCASLTNVTINDAIGDRTYSPTKVAYAYQNGDTFEISHVTGAGSGAYVDGTHGFYFKGGIASNFEFRDAIGTIESLHDETDQSSSPAPTMTIGSKTILRVLTTQMNPPNLNSAPGGVNVPGSVEIRQPETTYGLYSRLTMELCVFKCNARPSDAADVQGNPHIHVTRAHPNFVLQVLNQVLTVDGLSTGTQAQTGLWFKSDDSVHPEIQTNWDAAYGLQAYDWMMAQRNGLFTFQPADRGPIYVRPQIPPTVTSLAASSNMLGVLSSSFQGYVGYDFAMRDPLGGYSLQVKAASQGDLIGLAEKATISSGGTNQYQVNDILTLSGGAFGTAAQFKVTATDGTGGGGKGKVRTVTLQTAGQYTTVPANPVSTTGGGGSGAQLTVTWKNAVRVRLKIMTAGQLVVVRAVDASSVAAAVAKAAAGVDASCRWQAWPAIPGDFTLQDTGANANKRPWSS